MTTSGDQPSDDDRDEVEEPDSAIHSSEERQLDESPSTIIRWGAAAASPRQPDDSEPGDEPDSADAAAHADTPELADEDSDGVGRDEGVDESRTAEEEAARPRSGRVHDETDGGGRPEGPGAGVVGLLRAGGFGTWILACSLVIALAYWLGVIDVTSTTREGHPMDCDWGEKPVVTTNSLEVFGHAVFTLDESHHCRPPGTH